MPQPSFIIGISGTNGAGKDTVAELLAQRHNLLFISVSDILRDELRRRGQGTERENTRTLSAEWRRELGLSVLVDKAVDQFKKNQGQYDGLVIASLRNPYEGTHIHELGGYIIWVDADPHIRYDRIQSNRREGRSADDQKTFDQFLAEERTEMQRATGADEATLNTAALRDQSDATLINDGSDLEKLAQKIDTVLGSLRDVAKNESP